MTLGQESLKGAPRLDPMPRIESLAGVFHPHAIEVQDFSHYALVIDVRTQEAYADDHIPGAVRLSPAAAFAAPPGTGEAIDSSGLLMARESTPQSTTQSAPEGLLPPALAAQVASLQPEQAILVYCGRGGLDSLPVARALRWRGWAVDVLPGGWINYRRWVQAGLEVLPRMVSFRVIACSLGTEAGRVLQALRDVGQQVLDVEALAICWRASLGPAARAQPAQAWFESQLLQAMRTFDPRLPVWISDVGSRLGALCLPGALTHALAIAPVAKLQVDLAERVRGWQEDEPMLSAGAPEVLRAVEPWLSNSSKVLRAELKRLAANGDKEALLSRLLVDVADLAYLEEAEHRGVRRHVLLPLSAESLAPGPLADAVHTWLHAVQAPHPEVD